MLSAEQGKLLQNSITNIQGSYLPLSGGNMKGNIVFNNNLFLNWKDTKGSIYQVLSMKSNDEINIGNASFPLNLGYILCKIFDGENDGLVAVNSGKWGNFLGLITAKKRGISHGDVIDLTRIDIEDFNVCEFYVNLVSKLKDMGF